MNKLSTKLFMLCLFNLFIISFISCSNQNEKFLLDYENYVKKIEEKVELKQSIAYDECELELAKYTDRYEKLSKSASWKNYEETKYQQLNNRISIALGTSTFRDASSGVLNFIKNLGESLGY